MSSPYRPRIAIIGAGAAGTAALYELHRTMGDLLPQVLVIDGNLQFGAGRVYQPDLECALVNRQARYMSVIFDDQDDFVRWAATTHRRDGRQGLPPIYSTRTRFGDYLTQRHNEISERWSSAGSPLQRVGAYAEKVEQRHDKVIITSADGIIDADYAVLCTGHGRTKDPTTVPTGLLAPYPLSGLLSAATGARNVAILGAGLTAIDCALALLSTPHVRVGMFSRTGILPDIRAEFDDDLPLTIPERPDPAGATLGELRGRFFAELAANGITEHDVNRYIDRLRAGTRSFMDGKAIPEADQRIQNIAITMANRDLPTYWFGFSAPDRVAFQHKYFRLMQAVCSPIPHRTGEILRNALDSGWLCIGVGGIVKDNDGWSAGRDRYDLAVDGTGAATSAGQVDFEAALVCGEQAVADTYGGIQIEWRSGRLVRPDGDPSRIYALGFATRGSLLYSSSLYQATRNSRDVAASIADHIRNRIDERAVSFASSMGTR